MTLSPDSLKCDSTENASFICGWPGLSSSRRAATAAERQRAKSHQPRVTCDVIAVIAFVDDYVAWMSDVRDCIMGSASPPPTHIFLVQTSNAPSANFCLCSALVSFKFFYSNCSRARIRIVSFCSTAMSVNCKWVKRQIFYISFFEFHERSKHNESKALTQPVHEWTLENVK